MGFRLFRRIKVAPGVTFNLSKRGASVSLGEKGAHLTIGTKGVQETIGLRGTGAYWTERQNWRHRRGQGPQGPTIPAGQWWTQFFVWLAVYFGAFALVIALLEWAAGIG